MSSKNIYTYARRREELEAYLNFVSNFHPALQFTSTITETELPYLDINLRISDARIQTSVHYKDTDTHNYLHLSSFHPNHCKRAISYSQFLRLRRLCLRRLFVRSREMVAFFSQRGYPRSSLKNDLQRVATISLPDVLRPSEQSDTTVDRVPLVLTPCLTPKSTSTELSHSINRSANSKYLPTSTSCGGIQT